MCVGVPKDFLFGSIYISLCIYHLSLAFYSLSRVRKIFAQASAIVFSRAPTASLPFRVFFIASTGSSGETVSSRMTSLRKFVQGQKEEKRNMIRDRVTRSVIGKRSNSSNRPRCSSLGRSFHSRPARLHVHRERRNRRRARVGTTKSSTILTDREPNPSILGAAAANKFARIVEARVVEWKILQILLGSRLSFVYPV